MPASVCHKIFAEKLLDTNKSQVSNIDAYLWGAQGPDFFYCHRILPWMKGDSIQELGDSIHGTDPDKLLSEMCRLSQGSDILTSYLYGFVSHYALDSSLHPYIEYKANEMYSGSDKSNSVSSFHNEIESALDSLVLRYEKEKLVSDIKLQSAFPNNESVMNSIAKLWSELVSVLFAKTISERLIYQAETDCIKVFSHLNDKSSFKMSFFSRFESGRDHRISCHIRPLIEDQSIDCANFSHNVWGNGSTEDYFELEEKAIVRAKAIYKKLLSENLDKISDGMKF